MAKDLAGNGQRLSTFGVEPALNRDRQWNLSVGAVVIGRCHLYGLVRGHKDRMMTAIDIAIYLHIEKNSAQLVIEEFPAASLLFIHRFNPFYETIGDDMIGLLEFRCYDFCHHAYLTFDKLTFINKGCTLFASKKITLCQLIRCTNRE